MRALKILIVIAVALLISGLLLTRPGPVDAVGWTPPTPPEDTGILAENTDLRQATLLALGAVSGPEDIAIDTEGNLYSGTADGRIVRISPDARVETLTHTGGRPLGMDFDAGGRLVVADADLGLIRVDMGGEIEVLTSSVDGTPILFADDVAVAADGTIYFSDASTRFGLADYQLDLIEGRANGRLLAFDPDSGETRVLLDGLYFANGVTLSAEQDYLLVTETARYQITRYWLSGERAGQHDIFASNLPGFPDNISTRPDGSGYWVAIPSRRNPQLDSISHSPRLRNLTARLPSWMQPAPEHYGMVLLLDRDGEIRMAPRDPDGEMLYEITSATEHAGMLYLGSLGSDRIGQWAIPVD
ncbi:SMP-30/gluconolactonase/LRE family protein [Alcanivorax sp. JB21]|uniref:SMP-30/gluconolactonase/LRE family protein n=1 Tax=Alcanivorax limicola TaxID=2874102 RepID=UPI001CBF3A15|nr:SMP-30/gluconolactonase/LRE family protein [Alcanivorax limicola]MBZ2188184.1 SMP-30/gluconolactonase/LRE family protein [Alcanivorax limicola]